MPDSTRESDRILREAKRSLAVQRDGGTHRPAPRGSSIGKASAEVKLKALLKRVRNIAIAVVAIWIGARCCSGASWRRWWRPWWRSASLACSPR